MRKSGSMRALCCLLLFTTCVLSASDATSAPWPRPPRPGCVATVDLLFVYTDPVLRKSPGSTPAEKLEALQAKLEGTAGGLNQILENSRIPVKVRVVGVRPTGISEAKVMSQGGTMIFPPMTTYLHRVTHDPNVAQLRYQLKADVVSLVVLNRTGKDGIAHHWSSPWMNFNTRAFSVLKWRAIADDGRLLAHEFGHNTGCGHQLAASWGSVLFPFSRGWIVQHGGAKACTVMAVSTQCGRSLLHFSNPCVKVNMGTDDAPVWKRTGSWPCANNALSMTLVRWKVANWGNSLPPPTPPWTNN